VVDQVRQSMIGSASSRRGGWAREEGIFAGAARRGGARRGRARQGDGQGEGDRRILPDGGSSYHLEVYSEVDETTVPRRQGAGTVGDLLKARRAT